MQHKKAAEIGKRLQLLDHLNRRRIGVPQLSQVRRRNPVSNVANVAV
jgi:hypothetical protein